LATQQIRHRKGEQAALIEIRFKGLERMRDELLPMAQKMGRNLDVELHMLGSETKEMRDALKPNSVDDPTQSWKRYPDQESWLNGFMGATLDNCAYCLKPSGVLAINIANVSSYKGSLQNDFVALAKSKGFTHVETLTLLLSAMPGAKHKYDYHAVLIDALPGFEPALESVQPNVREHVPV
jgi:hypothetical protein